MTEAFFSDVRRFFALLDLDRDGLVDQEEATLGLSECFEAVHRINHESMQEEETSSHKEKVVHDQVAWLFSASAATANSNHQHQSEPHVSPVLPGSHPPSPVPLTPLTIQAFESCYQALLQSAYEQEVLHLDLSRGINALVSSAHWQSLRIIIDHAKILHSRLSQHENPVEFANQIFAPFLAHDASPNAKRHASLQRLIETFIRRIGGDNNSTNAARSVTLAEWLRLWKRLLLCHPNLEIVLPAIQTSDHVHTQTQPLKKRT